MDSHSPSSDQIIQLTRKFGNSAADAIFDPSSNHFTIPEIEGLIAYHSTNSCCVVVGDPICSSENLMNLVLSFHDDCKQKHYVFNRL